MQLKTYIHIKRNFRKLEEELKKFKIIQMDLRFITTS